MEYDTMENPLLDLCPPPPLDANGMLTVPAGPGTGLELAPEKLKRWLVSGWVETL
jgi:D-galactarolactone cycloisomerase